MHDNNSDLHYEEKQVSGKMFDRIARRYDFLNHFLTAGLDFKWRKVLSSRLIKELHENEPGILDVATGTGDLAFSIYKRNTNVRLTCVDVSEGMLDVAAGKMKRKGMEDATFQVGDAANLEFGPEVFSAVTCAFGVRNFPELDKSLSEFKRVLKKNGRVAILEFGWPSNIILSFLYRVFSVSVIPLSGALIAGDKGAYNYLNKTIKAFPYGDDFLERLKKAGFSNLSYKKLAGGIVYLYEAEAK